jgi:hypothetical protein
MTEEIKPFIVDKNSWHYKLNLKMLKSSSIFAYDSHAELYIKTRDNFCKYWRLTAINIFKLILAFTFLLIMLAAVGIVLFGIGLAFYTDAFVTLAIGGAATAVIAAAFGTAFLIDYSTKRKKNAVRQLLNSDNKQGLLVTKYTSWKQKICPTVEFK